MLAGPREQTRNLQVPVQCLTCYLIVLYVLQQEKFKLVQDPFNLQRAAEMLRASFSDAQATANCVKSVSAQELLLRVFDIQVACLAHIYHKTPGTELSSNDN